MKEKIAGTDLYFDILEEANRRAWRVFLFGDTGNRVESAASYVREHYPTAVVTGYHHGYVEINDPKPLEIIRNAEPDILFVGLGLPRQEQWLLENRRLVNVPVCIAVGAGIAYISQKLPRAPRWIQFCGLEWLFRFLLEPRRLWRRYLIGNPMFLFRVLKTKFLGRNSSHRVVG